MGQRPHDAVLSADAVDRICASIGSETPPSPAMLELAAAAYRELNRRRRAGSGRGMKTDLQALSRAISTAQEGIGSITPLGAAYIGLSSQLGGYSFSIVRLAELERELSALQKSIDFALYLLDRPVLERTPGELTFILDLLASAYKRATGQPVTHTANRDGEHVGVPLSPFGRFATAFFAEVDPNLSPNKLANAIRRALPTLKRPLSRAQ